METMGNTRSAKLLECQTAIVLLQAGYKGWSAMEVGLLLSSDTVFLTDLAEFYGVCEAIEYCLPGNATVKVVHPVSFA